MKPIIGILGNTFMTEPGAFVSAEKEYVNMGYIRGINRNGGIAVLLPTDTLLTDAASAMHIIDGLTGIEIAGRLDFLCHYFSSKFILA